jgi:cardiolipin synthase
VLLMRGSYGATAWLFLVAGITDALDGFIARRFNQMTHLGSILDPVADKILILTTVIILMYLGKVPWWVAAAIVVRDMIIIGGAITWYLKTHRFEMDPSMLSKVNTFLQIGLVYLMIAQLAGLLQLDSWLPSLFLLVLASTLGSGIHYVFVWGRRASVLDSSAEGEVLQKTRH